MNEYEMSQAFSQQLDRMLAGEDVVDGSVETMQMLGIARRLANADFSGESSRRSGYKAPIVGSRGSASYLLKIAAGMVLVCLVVLSVPPLRNLAQDIIARIGGVTITNAPVATPDVGAEVTTIASPNRYSVDQASEAGQLQVLSLANVPAGYQLSWRDASYDPSAGIHSASTNYSYNTTCDDGTTCLKFFWIVQTQYDVGSDPLQVEFHVGDAGVYDVTVRGEAGIAVDGALQSYRQGEHNMIAEPVNRILWIVGDTHFMIFSNDLSVEELIALAETLE